MNPYDPTPKSERNNRIIAMRKSGKTINEIAREFNISSPRVCQILARAAKEQVIVRPVDNSAVDKVKS